ncbi:MAG: hypothetical protein V3T77_04745 [Planctomycetota bacterium]
MSLPREEIRRRVRALVEEELGQASSPSQRTEKPQAMSEPTPAVPASGFVTVREVTERIRKGESLEYPPGTRFTPLARETLERHLPKGIRPKAKGDKT